MSRLPIVLSLVALACSGADDDPKTAEPTGSSPVEPGVDDNFGVVEDQGDAECDNLDPSGCFYPFPTAHFIDTSSGTPSLRIPEQAMPGGGDAQFLPDAFQRFEAYGVSTPILFQLPGAVAPELFPLDGSSGLAADSHVVVLDANTGERLPGWLETDYFAVGETEEVLFTYRPAAPWPRGTDVVVGVVGLEDGSGGLAPAAEGFQPLRDGEASVHTGVHQRRPHFESVVFPVLEAEGIDRSELQLAWSFPVRTDASATRRLLEARDAIYDALPPEGPAFRIDAVIDCPVGGKGLSEECHPDIRTIVDGTLLAPSVLGEPDDLGVRNLLVDASGSPYVDGVEEWPFRVQIPHTAYDPARTEPVPVLQYGHGFLGSYREGNNGWLRELAERKGAVLIATSMQGMNEQDSLVWTGVLFADAGRFPELSEASIQGVVNQVLNQTMMKTSFAALDEPWMKKDDGTPVYDASTVYYHGNSQGGSVGTVTMGIALDVTRADLGVPGSGYPFLLHRSSVFQPFALPIQLAYPDPDGISKFLALLGTGWDDVDPLTWAPHIHTDPADGTPQHEALLHVAKEDAQVHNEASFILGRAAGASLMVPAVRPVWGLPELTYPASPGVAVVEVDFMVPDDPTPLDPPDGDTSLPNDGDTHGWLRKWEPAQDQMWHFFETGELIDVCGGEACVTEPDP